MPPRPAPLLKSKHTANRLSAVYIGANPSTSQPTSASPSHLSFTSPPNASSSHIPDLPEPPSPGASSSGSGLPSPPATNSTGSGSTNDDPQTERPVSFASSSGSSTGGSFITGAGMLKGPATSTRSLHRSNSSISSIGTILRPHERQSILEEPPPPIDDELEYENDSRHDDDDGDDTARFNLRSSNENVLALQRVKSLTQRNRLALDKLSSYPRSGTPSSASGSSTTKSTASRLSQSRRPPEHTPSPSTPYDPRSGSETERESKTSSSHSHYNHNTIGHNSHQRTLSYAPARATTPPPPSHHRTRVPSAPSSPMHARVRNDLSNGSGGSSPSRRRKRVSMAEEDETRRGTFRAREREREREREGVLGSARRRGSPPTSSGGARRRAALPVEFRGAADDRPSTAPEPMTPFRAPSIAFTSSNSSSASASASIITASSSASGSGSGTGSHTRPRSSRHSHSTDLSYTYASHTSSTTSSSRRPATAHAPHTQHTPVVIGMGEYRERRQSLRTGSAESALALGGAGGGRSLVGEGLRAAGLSPTRRRAGQRLSLGGGAGWDSDGDEREEGEGRSRGEGRRRAGTVVGHGHMHVRGGEGVPGRAATSMAEYRYLGQDRGREYYDDEYEREEEGERRRALRNSRSAGGALRDPSLARDRDRDREYERSFARDTADTPDRAPSALSRYGPLTRAHVLHEPPAPERHANSASPFGSRRYGAPAPREQREEREREHTRLMVESLAMFEGHVVRAGLGAGTGVGGGELVRGAQGVVGAAERLNGMLRYGTARALEEEVNAEVEDAGGGGGGGGQGQGQLWGRVGAEYREGLRVSDELVRGLTGLLLSVGKAVRDLGLAAGAGGEGGVHGRSVSLDEEGLRMNGERKRGSMSPDVVVRTGAGGPGSSGGGSGSGRRSVESRRSWEPSRETLRDDVSRRLVARAESALSGARPQSAFSTLRDRERERAAEGRYETPPPPPPPPPSAQQSSTRNPATGSGSMSTRRLFTPREQREMQQNSSTPNGGGMPTIHSQEALYGEYEPSPTPASRMNQTSLDRSRTLPPLAVPRPLPSLPSESLRRNQTVSDRPAAASTVRDRSERRKVTLGPISTVRGTPTTYFPASLTTPSNATTALTPHTVSTQTPERTAFPSLPRTDSDRSLRESSVTFSRPSAVSSVSALSGVQQQHMEQENQRRQRSESGASSGAEPSTSVPPSLRRVERVQVQVMSGEETERDTRRKTVGRASLDGVGMSRNSTVHAADRSAAVAAGLGVGGMGPPMNTARRERRRTVTDIWPQG